MQIKVDWDDAILAELINNGLDAALMPQLEKACLMIEAAAKKNCPVDDGQLRQSIESEVKEENGKLVGYIGSNVEYAPYVEYGTGIYAADGNGRQTPWVYQSADGTYVYTQGNQPQPFLQPAIDDNQSNILEMFEGLI